MLISVIVPLYNAQPYLQLCISSILAQDYPHFELIIVNDGSTDGSAQVCADMASQDARIRLINQPNQGVSVARNTGLSHVQGDYFTFVDADDWVAPTYLSTLLALRDKAPKGALLTVNHYICRGKSQKPAFTCPSAYYTTEQACAQTLYHLPPDVSPCAKLYERALASVLHYPKGRIFEDTYVMATLLLATHGVQYEATPQYYYRCNDETKRSISKAEFTTRSWQYIEAVSHMTEGMLRAFPALADGCERRQAHAYLSLRRLLTHCPDALKDDRKKVNDWLAVHAHAVCQNPNTPKRDVVALRALALGDWAFDLLWAVYQQIRRLG